MKRILRLLAAAALALSEAGAQLPATTQDCSGCLEYNDQNSGLCYTCEAGKRPNNNKDGCIAEPVCNDGTSYFEAKCRVCRRCYGGAIKDPSGDRCICTGGRTYVNNQCTCPAASSGQYYNDGLGQCQCPTGSRKDQNSDRCICESGSLQGQTRPSTGCPAAVTCTGGQINVNGICQCPGNQLFNQQTQQCYCPGNYRQYNSNTQQCQCPVGSGLNYDSFSGNCVCPSGQVYNNGLARCQSQCQSGQTYNSITGQCEVNCPSGQVYSSVSQRCVCPGSGQIYDSVRQLCYCPGGQTYNSGLAQCVCPSGQQYNQNTQQCQVNCPSGQTYDSRTGRCVCPSGQQYNSRTGQCECPTGQIYDNINLRCYCTGGRTYNTRTSTCDCPTGQFFDTRNNICSCPGGQFYDAVNQRCNCPAGQQYDSRQGICTCPAGQIYDSLRGQCYCSGGRTYNSRTATCECPAGQTYNSVSQVCSCPAGQSYNSVNQRCECPVGLRYDSRNGQCVCQYSGQSYDSLQGKCVCPAGQSLNTQTGLCGCPAGQSYNAQLGQCVCPAGQSYDQVSGRCVCPTGLRYDSRNGQCVCQYSGQTYDSLQGRCVCPSGQTLNTQTGLCGCPAGQQYNAQAGQCVCPAGQSYDSRNGRCVCPTGQTYDSRNGRCVCPGEAGGQYYDAVRGQCVCPAGQSYDAQSSRCVCPATQTYNSRTGQCECPIGQSFDTRQNRCVCPVGQTYNAQAGQCVCPAGQTYDAVRGGCFCPQGQTYNAQAGQCVCPAGQSYDANSLQCVCPAGQSYVNGRCQCPQGQTYDARNGVCGCPPGQQYDAVALRCVCPTGQTYDANRGLCVCPAGQSYDAVQGRCVCPATQSYDARQGKCVCPAGQSFSANLNQCVCPAGQSYDTRSSRCVCPTGQSYDARNGQCICPGSNQTYDAVNGRCVCPQGQTLNVQQRLCVCPAGQSYDAVNGQCVCPPGQQYVNGRCQCPTGQTYDSRNGICVCPPGQSYDTVRRGCFCPTGQIYNAQQGLCSCPSGQEYDAVNGRCVCTGGRSLVNGVCVCPQGQTYNSQLGFCACPTGQSYDAARLACVCPPNTTYDRNRGLCKPSCQCYEFVDASGVCKGCPFGQLADSTGYACRAAGNTCVGRQVQGDMMSCYRCRTCEVNTSPDSTRTQCVPDPLPTCGCLARRDGYNCIQCGPTEIRDANFEDRCMTIPQCPAGYIRRPRDTNSCAQCEQCPAGQVANASGTACVTPQRCSCNQYRAPNGYSCSNCPPGQLVNEFNQCVRPSCPGLYSITRPVSANQCEPCQDCPQPQTMPNEARNQCVPRPKPPCTCLQSRSQDGYSCFDCPYGQIRDPRDQTKCMTPMCTGRMQYTPMITEQNCGRCATCQWPRQEVNASKTGCIDRVPQVCSCREKRTADGYGCEACPTGYIRSESDEKVCIRPTCPGQYAIQLAIDDFSCGRCDKCNFPYEQPNPQRNACVPRPKIECPCLSRRSFEGYTCEACPAGQVQVKDIPEQCYQPQCYGPNEILPRVNANTCGACTECQWPRYIPNDTRDQCIPRPIPRCNCLQKYSLDGYECIDCPYGQRVNPQNNKECVPAPTCTGPMQYLGEGTIESCYNCRMCQAPFKPRDDRTGCYREREVCNCNQKYGPDGYTCVSCPDGQTSDSSRLECYPAPQCFGPNEINGNRSNCYQCQQCPPGLIPNEQRSTCVRPPAVCDCHQRQSADTYSCVNCGFRQIQDPTNQQRCIPATCNTLNPANSFFREKEFCYQCEECPVGYKVNAQKTGCDRIRETCTCTQKYDENDPYVCVPCGPFEVATNNNQRCQPRQCSGLNEVLGTADKCYQCEQCPKGSTPDNQRRRCLRFITTTCACDERFDDFGMQCVKCPIGTRPSLDNKSCVDVNCHTDQIYRSDLLCPQCEWCPPGTVPDPTRRFCIVKPRPPTNVNGRPTCDEYSVFSLDKKECIKCPGNLKSSSDNMRCLSQCTGDMDIVQADGSCFTCCNGNVPNESKTRCVKPQGTVTQCTDREVLTVDRSRCEPCPPYQRAQRGNTVCLADTCAANQIVTWQGTCSNCPVGETKIDAYSCTQSGQQRLNAQIVSEKVEEVSSTDAKKEKAFPTAIVAGLGILIMVLSGVTAMICLRSREKTNTVPAQVQEENSNVQNEIQSFDHLVGQNRPQMMQSTDQLQKIPEEQTDESGSNGKNSE